MADSCHFRTALTFLRITALVAGVLPAESMDDMSVIISYVATVPTCTGRNVGL
jgi:hypothetical protein